MEFCPISHEWCSSCGGKIEDLTCYWQAKNLRIKELSACPALPFKRVPQGIKSDESLL